MSVLIKGMKMPKDCPMCPCAHWNKNDVMTGCELVWRHVPDSEIDYWQSDKRPDWCPLVEVPPHGRLVDADALKATFCAECNHTITCEDCDIDYHIGRLAPTIIEAEEGEPHEQN